MQGTSRPSWRGADLAAPALGALVAAFGLVEVLTATEPVTMPRLLVALLMGVAVGCHRQAPALGLGVLWLATTLQLLSGSDLMVVQLSYVVVLYGCARHGRLLTLWAALLSQPVALLAGLVMIQQREVVPFRVLGEGRILGLAALPLTTLGVIITLLLVVPWLAGLTLRFSDRARESRRRATQAQAQQAVAEQRQGEAEQVARAVEERAQLARDVHDVVGHSLAVILAQAEAARYLPDDELGRIRQSMAAIADSARESLGEVGAVLAGGSAAEASGRFPRLVAQSGATTPRVRVETAGLPRPLPPDLDVAAERVLRELVTNALKHGAAEAPIQVHVGWGRSLEVAVTNRVGAQRAPGTGSGLAGVRRRLAAVGGTLEVQRRDDEHRAIARLPLGPI